MKLSVLYRCNGYLALAFVAAGFMLSNPVDANPKSKFHVEVDAAGQPLRNVSGRTVGGLAPYGRTVGMWCSLAGGNKLDAVALDVYVDGKISPAAMKYGAKPETSVQELCEKHWMNFRR
jgi:hypothetical protein